MSLFEFLKEKNVNPDVIKLIHEYYRDKKNNQFVRTSDEHSEEGILAFPFGKYKHIAVRDVFEKDKQYVEWCLNNDNMKNKYPDFIFEVQKIVSQRGTLFSQKIVDSC